MTADSPDTDDPAAEPTPGSAAEDSTTEDAADPDDGNGDTPSDEQPADTDQFYDALESLGRPVVSATRYAQLRDSSQATAAAELDALAESGAAERLDVSPDPVVWYPSNWAQMTDRERLVVFPERRSIVADQPTQFTRAQLTQFAHLLDTTGSGAYLYEIRPADVWQAPYERFEGLLDTVRSVLPEQEPALEEWMADQHRRANLFTLRTHEDGYVVLEAESAEMMGNVARQKLDGGQLRAPVSDTESWVAEERVAEVKRALYEAGYPVRDERDLDGGDPLPVDLKLDLRPYQQTWVSNFIEHQAGVLVGPPGSGKTVAALAILAAIEGETLVLVPGRELAGQWRAELLDHTTLTEAQIGEYHGGEKEIRPITITSTSARAATSAARSPPRTRRNSTNCAGCSPRPVRNRCSCSSSTSTRAGHTPTPSTSRLSVGRCPTPAGSACSSSSATASARHSLSRVSATRGSTSRAPRWRSSPRGWVAPAVRAPNGPVAPCDRRVGPGCTCSPRGAPARRSSPASECGISPRKVSG